MSSIAAFSEIRKCLDIIYKEEDVKENVIKMDEIISEVNLFNSTKVRELVKFRFPKLFETYVVRDSSSFVSALLCYSLFKVVAFEHHYGFGTDLTLWEVLDEVHDSKKNLVYQLATCLLLRGDEEVLNKHKKEALKLLKNRKSFDEDYLNLLSDFITAYKTALLRFFDSEVLELYVESDEANTEKMEVEIPQKKTSEGEASFHILIEAYGNGGVKSVIAASTSLSNNKLTELIADLVLDVFSESDFHKILGVIRSWVLYRPGFKFSITEKLCDLMERENYRTESMKLLTAIARDKSSKVMIHPSFLNFCIQITHCPELLTNTVTEEKLEFALAKSNFLTTLITRFDGYLSQHGIISGYVSDLISFLYLVKKSELAGENAALLEHSLKFLIQAIGESKKMLWDLPFVMSNNLKAQRNPLLPMLMGLKHSNQVQTSLLSTNLPAHDKQLFALLMKHYKQVKTRV
ncbi:unnamed protein product [Bursaphelenchus okinawaensis]|uniref:Uncharacterized protein n=1 Tax=Bursaphelenchus okinawaensis TaxID=465554 RepID=A0A811JU08_9BILA|nr:unnamed protein product [Bursaphelenchus okinawaensis]CAG9082897.1 unnamed protein product [Bursaphelenchus okinawaensis]